MNCWLEENTLPWKWGSWGKSRTNGPSVLFSKTKVAFEPSCILQQSLDWQARCLGKGWPSRWVLLDLLPSHMIACVQTNYSLFANFSPSCQCTLLQCGTLCPSINSVADTLPFAFLQCHFEISLVVHPYSKGWLVLGEWHAFWWSVWYLFLCWRGCARVTEYLVILCTKILCFLFYPVFFFAVVQ